MQSYVLQKGYKMPKNVRTRNRSRPKNPYNSYNNTSQAYVHYPQNEQNMRRKKRVRKRIKRQVTFVKALGAKNQPITVYMSILIVFLMGLGLVVSGSNVTIQRNINARLSNDLRSLEMSNTQIFNQILQSRNIEEIEYLARNNLGMSEPMPHQVVMVPIIEERPLVQDFTKPYEYELTLSEQTTEFFRYMFAFFTGD